LQIKRFATWMFPDQGCQMVHSFLYRKWQFWCIFRVLGWKFLCTFYATLVFLWASGIFSPFWYVSPRQIWQPCHDHFLHFKMLKFSSRKSFLFFKKLKSRKSNSNIRGV
jgi:hypothetical protein